MEQQKRKHVGRSYKKVDASTILSGRPAYTEDFIPPHALVIKIMRSPYAMAKIIDIDLKAALRIPGVEAIFTYKDVPKTRFTLAGQSYPEPSAYDSLILDQYVRYVGDAVAIVVAKDEKTAIQAMQVIHVKYDVMEPVLDIHTALDHPTVVHPEDDLHYNIPVGGDPKRNLACSYSRVAGDLEGELAKCDYVVEETYFDQATLQTAMETFRTFCTIDQFGRLVCTSSTQIPFHVRRHIARALEIPATKIRVIKPRIGGGFGSKQTACTELYCAFVTWTLKKPAVLVYTRHEASNCSTSRHAREWKVRLGATKDGIIQVIDMVATSDAGAYGTHAFTTFTAGEHKSVPLYNKGKAVRYESNIVYTNHMAGGAFRGYGATEALWPLECAVTKLAKAMGMDESELRLKNLIGVGETSLVYEPDEVLESGLLKEAIAKAKKMARWDERPHSWQIDETHRGGLGMALAFQGSGVAKIDTASVEIKLQDDGYYTLYTGSTDMGTGANTILMQMACEVLGCPLDHMTCYEADTDVVPFDPGSYASSTTYVTGTAAKLAAEDLKAKIIRAFARYLEVPEEEIEFDGVMANTKDGRKSMTTQELAPKLMVSLGHSPEQLVGFATWGSHTSPPPFMVGIAEVSVDMETGQVTPLDFYAVVDCGTIVNPALARVQAEGGIVQGIGMALTEEIRYSSCGLLETNNFMSYKIPTRRDMGRIHVDFVESHEPTGAFGVKSIGEVVINTSCPAIQGAILNACGAELTTLPMISEKVFQALMAKE
ncbi:xanthine dehydrogenase family protein molybdopterin-binding subunit [Veillonella criceti]|uniref:4-hydroxybenzoyl-CoA reductase subunit alpha n=1 Tax=Veillonella criceti TaxID=103891 RepID=A0A380NN01_9FIRM|nr:molybdopterin cofactor-binding domain-containing protein [Veillonella criceti]SUP43502.1 4-hydroxybenzoyl-CoA reductase subunit alpha [Veillonella criceti]